MLINNYKIKLILKIHKLTQIQIFNLFLINIKFTLNKNHNIGLE